MATVYLIGAGPGDPELMTRKAWRLLGEAQVVLHDALMDVAGAGGRTERSVDQCGQALRGNLG